MARARSGAEDLARARRNVIEAIEKAQLAARVAQEKKGTNLTILDVGGVCSYADAIVIVSATSDRQANAIADAIADAVKKAGGGRSRTEQGTGGWALLDFGDVVIHVFVEEARAFYDLDTLWSEVPRIAVPALTSPHAAAPGPSALAQRKRRA